MNKVIRDGMVAVLYSPGFGAGWSTWNSDEYDFLLFDADIVSAVEQGNNTLAGEIAERKVKELYGEDAYIYTGGAADLEIGWVPEGEAFEITEYDGSESLNIISQGNYKRA